MDVKEFIDAAEINFANAKENEFVTQVKREEKLLLRAVTLQLLWFDQ